MCCTCTDCNVTRVGRIDLYHYRSKWIELKYSLSAVTNSLYEGFEVIVRELRDDKMIIALPIFSARNTSHALFMS